MKLNPSFALLLSSGVGISNGLAATTFPAGGASPKAMTWVHDHKHELTSEEPKFGALSESLLAGSDLIYAFAKLRKEVLENYNDLKEPELILTQSGAAAVNESKDGKPKRYLKYDVTADALSRFIDLNRPFVHKVLEIESDETNTETCLNIETILHHFKSVNLSLKEFDDQFSDRQLVYAITINRTHKRITVIFRGSVDDGRDWSTNFNFLPRTLENPDELQDKDLGEDIQVHRGFYSYLNEEINDQTGSPVRLLDRVKQTFGRSNDWKETTKFDEIVNNLKYILEKGDKKEGDKEGPYHDYKVCISGHSLGGALSQLLAYQLAGSGALKGFENATPVTAITYASPKVGNAGFRKAFELLEGQGLLQHIRVSNAGDGVPASVPMYGYTQTGVNLHVQKDAPMEVGYGVRKNEAVSEQLKYAWNNKSWMVKFWKLADDFKTYHSPRAHYHNLYSPQGNEYILSEKTVDDLYRDYAKPSVAIF